MDCAGRVGEVVAGTGEADLFEARRLDLRGDPLEEDPLGL